MTEKAFEYWMLIKFIIAFFILYVLVPARISKYEKEASGLLDKVFIGLTHSVFWTIIIVHGLVFLKLYETFSLLFCYFVLYLAIVWKREKNWLGLLDGLGVQIIVYLLKISDEGLDLTGWLKRLTGWFRKTWKRLLQLKGVLLDPFYVLLPAIVFIASAALRFQRSLTFATFPLSDPYEHLAWVKYLGLNQIYYDGIYPHGYHAVISPMHKLFFIDPYWLIRFIGPLAGTLVTVVVYFLALRFTKNRAISLLALVYYGLIMNSQFADLFERNFAALPMEFSMIFSLCGLYFLYLLLKTNKKIYLLLFAECVAITLFIHPYGLLYLALWAPIFTAVFIIIYNTPFKTLYNIALYSVSGVLLGLMPLGIGRLMGMKIFAGSVEFIQSGIVINAPRIQNFSEFITVLFDTYQFLNFAIIVLVFLLVIQVFKWDKEIRAICLAILLSFLVTYLLFRGPDLHMPSLTHSQRTMVFLLPLLTQILCMGLLGMGVLVKKIRVLGKSPEKVGLKIASAFLCIWLLYQYPPVSRLVPGLYEYEAAVRNYLRIKTEYTALNWTIIGPPEQYQQALGNGWHVDLYRFVRAHTPEQLADPQYVLPIPTSDIFVFTEKVPLFLNRAVTAEDAQAELAPETGGDIYKEFYLNAEQRGIIEAKAIALAEAYRKTHDGVEIFYEDEQLRIYHINHTPPDDLVNEQAL